MQQVHCITDTTQTQMLGRVPQGADFPVLLARYHRQLLTGAIRSCSVALPIHGGVSICSAILFYFEIAKRSETSRDVSQIDTQVLY